MIMFSDGHDDRSNSGRYFLLWCSDRRCGIWRLCEEGILTISIVCNWKVVDFFKCASGCGTLAESAQV